MFLNFSFLICFSISLSLYVSQFLFLCMFPNFSFFICSSISLSLYVLQFLFLYMFLNFSFFICFSISLSFMFLNSLFLFILVFLCVLYLYLFFVLLCIFISLFSQFLNISVYHITVFPVSIFVVFCLCFSCLSVSSFFSSTLFLFFCLNNFLFVIWFVFFPFFHIKWFRTSLLLVKGMNLEPLRNPDHRYIVVYINIMKTTFDLHLYFYQALQTAWLHINMEWWGFRYVIVSVLFEKGLLEIKT